MNLLRDMGKKTIYRTGLLSSCLTGMTRVAYEYCSVLKELTSQFLSPRFFNTYLWQLLKQGFKSKELFQLQSFNWLFCLFCFFSSQRKNIFKSERFQISMHLTVYLLNVTTFVECNNTLLLPTAGDLSAQEHQNQFCLLNLGSDCSCSNSHSIAEEFLSLQNSFWQSTRMKYSDWGYMCKHCQNFNGKKKWDFFFY